MNTAESLDPIRHDLQPALGDLAEQTWLVGGVVRDAVLGRPLIDIDIATAHSPEQIARTLRKKFGGSVFPLGDEFGCWRITDEADTGQQIDVCPLRGGTIETDLDARDFTANALAQALAGDSSIVDRHNGLSDIEHEMLRMVSAQALDDDPLRMLRAARIAHKFNWDIEDTTRTAIAARASRMNEPAGERIFAELSSLLLHQEARRGWRFLDQLGLEKHLLPELVACRDVEQSQFHHLDVYEHTLAVLDNTEDIVAATDFWLPSSPTAKPWTDTQRLTLLLAALFHDLGKPETRAVSPTGRIGFRGHHEAGVPLVDRIAERWKLSGKMRRDLRDLVETHLALGFALHSELGRDRVRYKLRRRFGALVPEAIVLSVADRMATAGVADRRRWMRAHLQLAREVWAEHWQVEEQGAPKPLLDGAQIAKLLDLAPGPRIGELVERLAEEQSVAGLNDLAEAEKFLRTL